VLHQAAKLVAALLRVARVTVGVAESNGSLRRVYDSRHLQADCQKPGSAPEPYAEQSSTVYLYPFTVIQHAIMQHDLFKTYVESQKNLPAVRAGIKNTKTHKSKSIIYSKN